MLRRQYLLSIFTWCTFLVVLVVCHDYKGFDDSIPYRLEWPGLLDSPEKYEGEAYEITTPERKERYKCYMPRDGEEEIRRDVNYEGPSPFDLVSTLFSLSTCSYRIESYWTYEVCHGNYVKQFHEEREKNVPKVQEYFLGKWNKEMKAEAAKKFAEALKNGEKFQTMKVDGVHLPYLEIQMSDGTYCDLNGEHRATNVRYVCYPHGKNEVYSFKETSTCNYEVVILTPALCMHPEFNPKEVSENIISCVPLDGAPPKPRSLLLMEVENMKKILDGTLKSEVIASDLLPNLNKVVAAALGENSIDESDTEKGIKLSPIPNNVSPVLEFLEGKNCLIGGTGWWKYEFCYGRFVRQFHIDQNGESFIMLGNFDEELHKEWLKKNPQKRPKKAGSRTEITHLYQGGTPCEETGETRQTEVQLKCLENSTSMTAVKLFLMEPKTCHYILGVESPLLCEIIEKADEDGLINRNSVADEDDEMEESEENVSKAEDDEVQDALNSMFN